MPPLRGESRMPASPLPWAEAADDAAAPLGGDGERIEQVGEQARIADRRLELDRRRQGRRLQGKGENLGIGRLAVGLAEVLDAGLDEFARPVAAQPEHRPAIGIGGRVAEVGGGDVVPQHRDRVLRPQAQFGAGDVPA